MKKRSHVKNHFIPKFYLQQWYNNNRYFAWELCDNTQRFHLLSGHRNHGNTEVLSNKLYWLNTNRTELVTSLEKEFGEKERKWASIFRTLNSTKNLDDLNKSEQLEMIKFLINLRCRTPKIVKSLKSSNSIEENRKLFKNFLRESVPEPDFTLLISHPFVEDLMQNLPLETLRNIDQDQADRFLSRFGNGKLLLLDVDTSSYNLITSNYLVIDHENMIVFPISPRKILFIISENIDLEETLYFINTRSIDYIVTSINIGILNNHKERNLEIPYQIYGMTDEIRKILPENLLGNFFY